jgi:hypothetical protein
VGMSLSTSPTTRSSSSDLRCKQTIYASTTKNEWKRTPTGSDDWSFAWNVRSRHPSSRNRVGSFFPSHRDPPQYFEEMSPLFCTTEVPYDIIGEHMQEHVRWFGLSKKPRRLLVGGMKARQLLIATPLLKWPKSIKW